MTIVPALVGAGAKVKVCDPEGRREGENLLPGVTWVEDPYKATGNAQLLVLLTEWTGFRALNLKKIVRKMSDPVVADFRNVYSAKEAKKASFRVYASVGRADVVAD